ncbi:hypothetical protein K0M31_001220 [Melipona bicolor]|uniref:Uncharacterized protein n=1 Tax=Melipona bicolor TaxID=60889 RepID=A0AA40GF30_9HYME|nr:hypothetical protein K0M31_001220 [Melipona bicolor]
MTIQTPTSSNISTWQELCHEMSKKEGYKILIHGEGIIQNATVPFGNCQRRSRNSKIKNSENS